MLHPVGRHIVDVLDEYHVGAALVKVLDQSAVSAGTEYQLPVLVPHRLVVFVHNQSVGVVLLLREFYLNLGVERTFVILLHFGYLLAEQGLVLWRDGEMQPHLTVGTHGVLHTLNDMLLERGALYVAVFVKLNQRLRQFTITEVLLFQQEVYDGGVVAAAHIVVQVKPRIGHALVQIVEEGETAQVLKKRFHLGELGLEVVRHSEVGRGKGVEIVEHPCGGARCRHELQYFLVGP